MKIGIDIDGVIAQDLDVNKLQKGRDEEIYRNLPFDESSRKLLETLQQNFKIYLITARGQEFRRVTEEWLQKHNVPYHQIYFNPYQEWWRSPQLKAKIVEKENIGILIDDLPENINQINKETNCQGILFSNWNEISNVILPLLFDGGKEAIRR